MTFRTEVSEVSTFVGYPVRTVNIYNVRAQE